MTKTKRHISMIIFLALLFSVSGQALQAQNSPVPPYSPGYATPNHNFLSGFHIRFGWLNEPKVEEFKYAWIASFGYDFGLGRNFSIGIELQPAYRSISGIDLTFIPVYGFVNIKAGMKVLYPNIYIGVGGGAEALIVSGSIPGVGSFNDFQTNLAYRGMAGVDFPLGPLNIQAEYSLVQVDDPSTDSNEWRHYILIGFKF